jgi:peptidoglycan-associated lipoprotein
MTTMSIRFLTCLVLLLLLTASACRRNQPPVARPTPPAPPPPAAVTRPPDPPAPMREPVPPEPLPSDSVASRSLDDLNRDSPLQPVFFDYDSSEINDAARATLQASAAVLKKYPSWVVTIEGHCDERGTAEYNLALGERRAVAARICFRWASTRTGCARSAMAANFRSIPTMRRPRGAETAARTL